MVITVRIQAGTIKAVPFPDTSTPDAKAVTTAVEMKTPESMVESVGYHSSWHTHSHGISNYTGNQYVSSSLSVF